MAPRSGDGEGCWTKRGGEKRSTVSTLPASPHAAQHPSSGSASGRSTFSRRGRRGAVPPPRLRCSRAQSSRLRHAPALSRASMPERRSRARRRAKGTRPVAGGICRNRCACPLGPVRRTAPAIAARSDYDAFAAVPRAFANFHKLPVTELSLGGNAGAKRGLDVYMRRDHTYDFSVNWTTRAKC